MGRCQWDAYPLSGSGKSPGQWLRKGWGWEKRWLSYPAEAVGKEERLQDCVHITCGAQVSQSDIAGFLL